MRAQLSGLELEYETFGSNNDPLVLLIIGFSQQLTAWDARFCAQLAARGFRVVRFDNRDAGLSTKIDGAPRPRLSAIAAGDLSTVSYGIDDMANDAAALIEALAPGSKSASAHVVGVSMGGMIAQSLTIRHPNRVKSLLSIMSTTGDRSVGQSKPEALAIVWTAPPAERDAYIEHSVRSWHVLRSPGFTYDEARGREQMARDYDRSFYVEGAARQAAAILSQRDRTAALHDVKVPVTVIHGVDDPLIALSAGEATARAIPGAKLIVVPGLGHDLPEGLWPTIIDAVVENAKRAG
jgi:pimeloyl-ACP methyl ester carboxylesterase